MSDAAQPVAADADAGEGGLNEATTEVEAEFVVFRVLSVPRGFTDRGADESWTWEGERGPAAGDSTTVTVGGLTPEFRAALRALHAWRPFVLNSMFGGTYAGKTPQQLEATFEDLLPDEDAAVAELVRTGHTAVTLTVRRPARVLAVEGRAHRWLTGLEALQGVGKFSERAGQYLDVTAVRLLGPLGAELAPSDVTYRSNRAFLFAPGKTPMITDIQLRGGAVGLTVSSDGWQDHDWQPVTDLLAQPYDPTGGRLIESASRWLWAATAETKDTLRRFLFAYFGLEILANKCGKQYEEGLGHV